MVMEAAAQPIWDLVGVKRDLLKGNLLFLFLYPIDIDLASLLGTMLASFAYFNNAGERYEDSVFAKIPLYSAQYNFTKMYSEFVMGNRKNLLQYTDAASETIHAYFVGLYKVDIGVRVASISILAN